MEKSRGRWSRAPQGGVVAASDRSEIAQPDSPPNTPPSAIGMDPSPACAWRARGVRSTALYMELWAYADPRYRGPPVAQSSEPMRPLDAIPFPIRRLVGDPFSSPSALAAAVNRTTCVFADRDVHQLSYQRAAIRRRARMSRRPCRDIGGPSCSHRRGDTHSSTSGSQSPMPSSTSSTRTDLQRYSLTTTIDCGRAARAGWHFSLDRMRQPKCPARHRGLLPRLIGSRRARRARELSVGAIPIARLAMYPRAARPRPRQRS